MRDVVEAADENGHVFIAEGGDDYNGAKCWVAVDPAMIEENSLHQPPALTRALAVPGRGFRAR